MKELLAKCRKSVTAFFARLSRRQKVLLAALVVGGGLLVWLVGGWAPDDRYQTLMEGQPRELHSLLDLLDRQGIRSRLAGLPGGRLRLEVAAGEAYHRAVKIAGRGGYGTAEGMISEPLVMGDGGSFVMSTDKLRIQENEVKLRRVEEAILFNEKIASVRVVFTQRKGDIFSGRPEGKVTAAVGLRLEPRVVDLLPGEVQNIRGLVSGSFNIPVENIQVSVGGSAAASTASPIEARRERLEREIRQKARNLLLGQYREDQLEVEVAVELSLRDAEREETRGDPKGTAASYLKTKTTIPAGEIEQVTLTLKLALDRVKRLLQEEDELRGRAIEKDPDGQAIYDPADLDRRLREYEESQKTLLANLSPVPERTRVTLSITPFPSRTRLAEVGVAATPAASRSFWTSLVYVVGGGVVAALATVLVLVLVLVGRRRQKRRLASAGPDDETAGGGERLGRGFSACQETLELTREAARVVGERPEVAASILRLWLASGSAAWDGVSREEREEKDQSVSLSSAP
ncbi:MAG: hypothetical protein O7J95_02850 [Planctomycetota bacterium]|nr:hypothetical protein [Planctomycetota bacterium]